MATFDYQTARLNRPRTPTMNSGSLSLAMGVQELDLGIEKGLDEIVIWNRLGKSVRSQLDGFKLSVLEENRNSVWEKTFEKAPKRKVVVNLGSDDG